MTDHADTLRNLLAVAERSLTWLSSYPGGGAMGCYDEMRRAIAALEAGRSGDWVLVPRKPTPEMLVAANAAWFIPDPSPFDKGDEARRAVYTAMLAAAQQQPPPVEVTEGIRQVYSKVIRLLAGLVNMNVTDKFFELEALPRDHVMEAVVSIRNAMDELSALAQQHPAPSVSDDPFFGPLERRAVVFPPKPAPVSEPAASEGGVLVYANRVLDRLEAYFPANHTRGGDVRELRSLIRRLTTTGQPPRINIRCETREDGGWVGTTNLNVVRVESEDDGSFTAVTDYWPTRGSNIMKDQP